MNKYSESSLAQLKTCHPKLQLLFETVLETFDHKINEGHRNEHDQNEAFLKGKSKLKWPDGKHNQLPSIAVDVVPTPIDFSEKVKNIARFYYFAGYVKAVADQLKIQVRWGGDWDGDGIFADQIFDDLVHWELV